MSNYTINALLCTVIVLLAFWGMYAGWQKRKRQASKYSLATGLAGEKLAEYQRVLYAVTHLTESKLARVVLPGLEFRGYANVEVFSDGIAITVNGAQPAYLTNIQAVTTTATSLAKAVEKDGLVVIDWESAGNEFSSVLRFQTPQTQQDFITTVTNRLITKGAPVC